jgi:hypothetical protein
MTVHTNELHIELKGSALDAFALSSPDAAQMAAAWAGGVFVLAAPWQNSHPWVTARYNVSFSQERPLEVRLTACPCMLHAIAPLSENNFCVGCMSPFFFAAFLCSHCASTQSTYVCTDFVPLLIPFLGITLQTFSHAQDGGALVAFMPNKPGSIAYSCSSLSGRVVIYDFRIASVLRTVDLPQMVCSLATCSKSGVVAAGGSAGTVFLIDDSEVATHEFKGHLHPVKSVAFTLEGTSLVSAAGTSMYLWDC